MNPLTMKHDLASDSNPTKYLSLIHKCSTTEAQTILLKLAESALSKGYDKGRGFVYLIHFDTKLHHAGHYIGFSFNVDKRLDQHKAGVGARLLQVLNEKGINYKIVRVWENVDRTFERQLKNQKNAPRLCPICSKADATAPRNLAAELYEPSHS